MKKLLVLVLLLVGAATWAQSETGQWLHDGWSALQKYQNGQYATMQDSDFLLQGMFMGFVLGASRTMEDIQWIDIPDHVSFGQEYAVVGKYLDDHPELWNKVAEILIYRALHAVWPGKKSPPPPQ